eukprot:403363936
MNQQVNQSHVENQQQASTSYRLVQKKFFCHVCNKDFKKMSPVIEMSEVECPDCQQTFCEEISNHQQVNLVRASAQGIQAQQRQPLTPASPAQQQQTSVNQAVSRSQNGNEDLINNMMRGIFSQPQTLIRQVNVPQTRRVVRSIITDSQGNQAIIEEIYDAPQQPRQQSMIIIDESPIIGQGNLGRVPLLFGLNPFEMNFRSSVNDNVLEQILRMSMQDRGRSGTPPASEHAIKNLHEVQISEKLCKKNEKDGSLEQPRCTICCEDLVDKATMLPCGHMFNKECISEWLHQHNQCPVCRYELPTDDAEYEAKKLRETSNSSQGNSRQADETIHSRNQSYQQNYPQF